MAAKGDYFGRNQALDGLRGAAVLSVAIGHIATDIGGLGPAFQATIWTARTATPMELAFRAIHAVFNADAAVILFFVLSGLVLTRSLDKQTPNLQTSLSFTTRRILRLFPVAIAAAAIVAIVTRVLGFATVSLHEAIGSGLLYDTRLNGVIWTLQIELFGSALILCLWLLRRLAGTLALICCVAPLWTASWLIPAVPHWPFPAELPVMLPPFIAGALLTDLPEQLFGKPLLIGSVAVLLSADFLVGHDAMAWRIDTIAAAGLVGCVYRGRARILAKKPTVFLGRVSYPFYLLHVAGLYITVRLIPQLPWPFTLFVLDSAASVLIALSLAWIIHIAVELPSIGAGKVLSGSTRRTIPFPSVVGPHSVSTETSDSARK